MGYQISTGQPKNDFIDIAIRHVNMRQGVLGLKVKIMMALERKDKKGEIKVMPDYIKIHEPKDDERDIVPGVQFATRREEAAQGVQQ